MDDQVKVVTEYRLVDDDLLYIQPPPVRDDAVDIDINFNALSESDLASSPQELSGNLDGINVDVAGSPSPAVNAASLSMEHEESADDDVAGDSVSNRNKRAAQWSDDEMNLYVSKNVFVL